MNIFENYIAQDVFILAILEKIAEDWKQSHNKDSFNRDNFEEFVLVDLPAWFETALDDFNEEEFGEYE